MAFVDCLAVAVFLCVFLAYFTKARRSRHYPPGPVGRPIVGNMFDMPSAHQWLTFAKWSKEYDSDIVHAKILGQSVVVLNSTEAVTQLLEKRSSIYSDRPALTMLQDVLGFGTWNIPLMRYGLNWRLHRKCLMSSLHQNAVDAHHPIQMESARNLLLALLESPDKFRDHINSHAGRIILKLMYGYDVKPVGDYYVALTEEAFNQFNEIFHTGKFYLVDIFPFLKDIPTWVPFFKFHKIGAKFRLLSDDTINKPYNILRARMEDGSAPPCIVLDALEKTRGALPSSREVEIIKNMASATYGAGQDTTASTIASFILAMALNPDQQKKAQKEIDSLTRGVRLPDFGDKSSLKYLNCILLETLRWAPAAPSGVPHRVMEDDVYKGYDIPKGTVVYGNIWGMLHDETTFPEPASFNAERYLQSREDNYNVTEIDKSMENLVLSTAFGFGRRVCPGRHLAMNSAWLSIAQILATFDILKEVDKEGREIQPHIGFTNGITSHPEPYRCRLVPRSSGTIDMLLQSS